MSQENHQYLQEHKLYLPAYAILKLPIRECKTLCEKAKIYFGELVVLNTKRGYIPYTDEQLAKMKGVGVSTIERWHNTLEKAGFIKRETQNQLIEQNGQRRWKPKRKMFLYEEPNSNKNSEPLKSEGLNEPLKSEGISNKNKLDDDDDTPNPQRGQDKSIPDSKNFHFKQAKPNKRQIAKAKPREVLTEDQLLEKFKLANYEEAEIKIAIKKMNLYNVTESNKISYLEVILTKNREKKSYEPRSVKPRKAKPNDKQSSFSEQNYAPGRSYAYYPSNLDE